MNTIQAGDTNLWRKTPRLVAFMGLLALLGAPITLLLLLRSELFSDSLPLDEEIPQLSVSTAEGEEFSIGTSRGKKSLLLFFTVECSHCERALESLGRLYPQFENLLEIVPVSLSEADKTRDFLQKHRYAFPVFSDFTRKAKERFRITGVPALFLVDEHQMLRYRRVGERSLEADRELLTSFFLNQVLPKRK